MIGGSGRTTKRRMDDESFMRSQLLLSDRHRDWGDNCPATDLDFLFNEYNQGRPVLIVDYKFHLAQLTSTNSKTYQALSSLYNRHGAQLPFIVARYWTDTWAFRILPVNEAASAEMVRLSRREPKYDGTSWVSMSEREYVEFLYHMRFDSLREDDQSVIATRNTARPPDDPGAA